MFIGAKNLKPVDKRLVAPWVRGFASTVDVIENPVEIPLLSENNINLIKEPIEIDDKEL